jgi:hypothetical protein
LKRALSGRQFGLARVLAKAVRLYLTKRLDVFWGIVKEV